MKQKSKDDLPIPDLKSATEKLLEKYPLTKNEIVSVVFKSWEDIFKSKIGPQNYKIGKDILPQPQIMGFLLHELIPLNLASMNPKKWKTGAASSEFDACYIPNDEFSFEIKTSSSDSGIFGNRSYAHISESSKKRRGGFILAVNFEKFIPGQKNQEIKLIRFGWLDSTDWVGQKSESGQQSHLKKDAIKYKLITLWKNSKKR
jgi:hypothetical protein